MARTIDEELSQLERDVRQLKIEYEQYFGGGRTRPPAEIEWRIDTLIKRYSDRGAELNYGHRFRFSNLVQTYTKYREIFRKRLKQKEEGTVQRHFGSAAREIEAERARKRAAAEKEKANGAHLPFSISWKDPEQEKKKVEKLFEAFREAKAKAGEETESLTLDAFQKFVRQKTEQLKKQQQAHEVEYEVSVEGKHARLKARVKS